MAITKTKINDEWKVFKENQERHYKAWQVAKESRRSEPGFEPGRAPPRLKRFEWMEIYHPNSNGDEAGDEDGEGGDDF